MFRTALAAATACMALALPSLAHAGTPNTQEPVIAVAGADPYCNPGSAPAQGISEVLTSSLIAPGSAWYAQGVRPLSSDMVTAWRSPAYGDTYDQCGKSAFMLAQAFYTKALNFRNTLAARYPSKNITKIDIYALSYGTTVTRLCIQTIAGCAQLVDDWVAAVPPSHGSTSFNSVDCNYAGPYKFECQAGKTNGAVVQAMNGTGTGGSGDETPYGEKDPGGWIEYTTARAQNDGVIFPAGSEKLVGASNFVVTQPNGVQTTHGNLGNGTQCAGSSAWTQTGYTEAVAAELLDVTNRTGRLATRWSVFDAPLSCNWPNA